MKYLDRLRELHKRPPQALTVPTEAPFVGSVRCQGEPIVKPRGGQAARLAALRESFDLVMTEFRSSAEEIEVAWSIAVANMAAAEAALHADAAMIRAGWKPLREQAAAFQARIASGYAIEMQPPDIPKEPSP